MNIFRGCFTYFVYFCRCEFSVRDSRAKAPFPNRGCVVYSQSGWEGSSKGLFLGQPGQVLTQVLAPPQSRAGPCREERANAVSICLEPPPRVALKLITDRPLMTALSRFVAGQWRLEDSSLPPAPRVTRALTSTALPAKRGAARGSRAPCRDVVGARSWFHSSGERGWGALRQPHGVNQRMFARLCIVGLMK